MATEAVWLEWDFELAQAGARPHKDSAYSGFRNDFLMVMAVRQFTDLYVNDTTNLQAQEMMA